jgi:hypothetical protein
VAGSNCRFKIATTFTRGELAKAPPPRRGRAISRRRAGASCRAPRARGWGGARRTRGRRCARESSTSRGAQDVVVHLRHQAPAHPWTRRPSRPTTRAAHPQCAARTTPPSAARSPRASLHPHVHAPTALVERPLRIEGATARRQPAWKSPLGPVGPAGSAGWSAGSARNAAIASPASRLPLSRAAPSKRARSSSPIARASPPSRSCSS